MCDFPRLRISLVQVTDNGGEGHPLTLFNSFSKHKSLPLRDFFPDTIAGNPSQFSDIFYQMVQYLLYRLLRTLWKWRVSCNVLRTSSQCLRTSECFWLLFAAIYAVLVNASCLYTPRSGISSSCFPPSYVFVYLFSITTRHPSGHSFLKYRLHLVVVAKCYRV